MKTAAKLAAGTTAGLALAAGIIGLRLYSTDLDAYKKTLQATVAQQAGVKLALPDRLQWQLWPFGITLGALQLTTADGSALLEAGQAAVTLSPATLLGAEPRITALSLQDAGMHLLTHDGHSNWQDVLEKLGSAPDSGLQAIQLQKSYVDINGAATRIDIEQASVQRAQGQQKLQARLSYNHLDESGGNLLLQGSLSATLSWLPQGGLRLADSQVGTDISSTALPGQLRLDSSGTLEWQQGRLRSNALKTVANYRNLSMAEPATATLHSVLDIDLAAARVALPTLKLAWRPAQGPAVDADANLEVEAGGAFRVQDLVISTHIRDASGKALPLALQGRAQGDWRQGRLQLDNTVLQSADFKADSSAAVTLPALSRGLFQGEALLQGMTARLQLQSSGADKTRITVSVVPVAASHGLKASLESEDIRTAAALLGLPAAAGALAASVDLQSPQLGIDSLLQQARGHVSVNARQLQLPGNNPMQVVAEKLEGYQSLLPPLRKDVLSAATQGPGLIRTLQMETDVAAGVLNTRQLTIALEKATLKGSGQFDQQKQTLDYTLELALDKSLFADNRQAITVPMTCKGNLAEEQLTFIEALNADCKAADGAMNSLLSKALSRRFLSP
ncbi:MAG TPA: AsmA family protein [Moraxellaceae bacterium]